MGSAVVGRRHRAPIHREANDRAPAGHAPRTQHVADLRCGRQRWYHSVRVRSASDTNPQYQYDTAGGTRTDSTIRPTDSTPATARAGFLQLPTIPRQRTNHVVADGQRRASSVTAIARQTRVRKPALPPLCTPPPTGIRRNPIWRVTSKILHFHLVNQGLSCDIHLRSRSGIATGTGRQRFTADLVEYAGN